MTMNIDDPSRLNGTTVIGGDGEKLGSVDAVYYDNATDRPAWVAVRSGLFGTRVALVPLRRADYADDALRVPFDKVQLRNAPHHDTGRELSSSDEADLYRYYGIDDGERPIGRRIGADESVETAEFRTDGADMAGSVVLHAERPVVDTVAEPVERVRLSRGTVTEDHTVAGDVRKEQIEFDGPGPDGWKKKAADRDADADPNLQRRRPL